MSAESKIAALGITLPDAPKPGGVSILHLVLPSLLVVKSWVGKAESLPPQPT